MSHFSLVKKFNQKILGIPNRSLDIPYEEEYKLSYSQLIEEAEEFRTAMEKEDIIAGIDACVDSIIFALGILYKIGVTEKTYNKYFKVVMKQNMKKKIGVKPGRGSTNTLDAIKPKGWKSPEKKLIKIIEEHNNLFYD